jgi:threonine-phosphate decarboxylase
MVYIVFHIFPGHWQVIYGPGIKTSCNERGQELRKIIQNKVIHGGLVKKYHEETGQEMLDFSANINPFPPALHPEFPAGCLGYYPDDSYSLLKEEISRVFHRPPEEIAVGNGSIELIRVFCSSVLKPGDRVRIDNPTFGEYEFSSRLAGAVPAGSGEEYRARFLCNPNNPTGHLVMHTEVIRDLEECRKNSAMFFLDEAFIELADPGQSMVSYRDPDLFVLRSLTKSFAVPGIRFGYGFGDPDLISMLEMVRPPWSVNSFAERFALESFKNYGLLEESQRKIRAEREWMLHNLAELGLKTGSPSANFILLDTGHDVKDLCQALLGRGILVRDCHSFGLPNAIRVAVRTRDENIRLLEELNACLR